MNRPRATLLALGAAATSLLALLPNAPAEEPAAGSAPPDSFRSYQAHLAAAEKSLRLGEATELRRWLDLAPAEHRGWEWSHLRALADTSVRSVELGAPVLRLVLSPDGTRAATVEGKAVILRDPATLAEVGRIAGHTDAVHRAEFSPDGKRLVTVSRDVTSRVWELVTGAEIARIELANPAVSAAAFSPDGARVATCAWERDEKNQVHGLVWVWEAETGRVLARNRVGVKPLSAIRWLPAGDGIVVGSWDALVHVLDAEGKELRRIELPDEGVYRAIDDLALSPDGARVAVAARDRTVRILELATGAELASLHGHVAPVMAVAWSPDGHAIASASVDATVRLWSAAGEPRGVLRGPLRALRAVAWARGGSEILAAGEEGVVRAWRVEFAGGPERIIRVGVPYSSALSPDGSIVAVACHSGFLTLYRTLDGAEIASWQAHPRSTCHAAAFDTSGARLITASWDKSARVWEVATREEVARLQSESGVFSASISPDGSLAALSGAQAELWEIDALRVRHRFSREGAEPRRTDFDPRGGRLAVGWSDGVATVHDCATGERLAAFEGLGGSVESVLFASGGAELATAAGGEVRIHPAAGGAARATVRTGDLAIQQLAVAGDRLAACSDRLVLIDRATGGIVLERHLHPDSLYHVSASADGKTIATCCPVGEIAVLGTEAPVAGEMVVPDPRATRPKPR